MSCDKLHALIGGGVADDEVSAHLRDCAEARRIDGEIRSMRAALSRVKFPEVPEARARLVRAMTLRPAWPLAAAAAAMFAVVFWTALGDHPLPAEVRVAAARFDETAIAPVADLAAARRFVRDAFHQEMPMPDICGVEGCAHPGAGELPPMVFYREGDKRVGLTFSTDRFPNLPMTQEIDGLKCAVMEHDGKTIIVCGGDRGYHIWVARMPAAELGALVHRIPRRSAPAGAWRFTVSPMG